MMQHYRYTIISLILMNGKLGFSDRTIGEGKKMKQKKNTSIRLMLNIGLNWMFIASVFWSKFLNAANQRTRITGLSYQAWLTQQMNR